MSVSLTVPFCLLVGLPPLPPLSLCVMLRHSMTTFRPTQRPWLNHRIHLIVIQNDDDCRLRDELVFNLSDCPFYNETPAEIRSGMLTAEDLVTREGPFPKSLLGRHAIHTWLGCRNQLALKHQ